MSQEPTTSILQVDLQRGQTRRLPVSEADRSVDLGGRGLAGALRDTWAHLAWDDPEAPIILCPGRLAGVELPGTGRLTAAWTSPLTGTSADAGFGGRLGGALARAGLAGIVLTGRATSPVGLVIRDTEAELVDATAVAGLPTPAVSAALTALDGALVTGTAAWHGASYLAGAVVDTWHGPCRGGLGLALAAKNCCFVAATGHGRVPVADPAGLDRARAAILRLIGASSALGPGGLGGHGSAALFDLTHGRRMMPTRNFRETFFPQAPQVNAPRLEAQWGSLGTACPGCPVDCHRLASGGIPLPGLDALSHFTALLGLADVRLAVTAQAACWRLGLDPVSVAATLATQAECDGREPSAAWVLAAIAALADGRDAGREGARGAKALAAARGRPETAMVVKGMELPAFDPRGAYGLALGLAVSSTGPDAWRAGCLAHELLRKPVATDRFTFEGKARAVFLGENATAAMDSLGVCPWLALGTSLEEWGQALAALTGEEVTAGGLARLGERTVFRERVQGARCGLTARDDDLPERFFREPGSSGDGIEVPPLGREDFLCARGKYYRLRGLTPDGLPDPARARELDLPWTR